jgi:hypothetical protein
VLYAIKVGRAAHDDIAATDYDAHNCFELRYSEPVDIGTDPMFSAASPTATNVPAQNTFSSAGEHGGYISVGGTGIQVAGYFFYATGSTQGMQRGSRDPVHPFPDSLYRPDAWRLRIFLSGFATGGGDSSRDGGRLWPGWQTGVPEPITDPVPPADNTTPSTLTPSEVTFLANQYIVDTASNTFNMYPVQNRQTLGTDRFTPLDPLDTRFATPQDFTGRWDVDPPAFSYTELPSAGDVESEIIPVSLDGGYTVAKLDFFIQDNFRENDNKDGNGNPLPGEEWNPYGNSGQIHPDNRKQPRGIRDSSLWYPTGASRDAFKIGIAGGGPRVSNYNNVYETGISHRFFVQGPPFLPNLKPNDPYFSLLLSTNPWRPDDAFLLEYDHASAYITDLAGNLLPSTLIDKPLPAIDQVPPKVLLTLAPVGDNRIYLHFSEPVFHGTRSARDEVSPSDFILNNASVNIDTTAPLKFLDWGVSASDANMKGVLKAVLTLTGPLTVKDALQATLSSANIFDYRGNDWNTGHPVTDVGLGVAAPVWAADGYDFDGLGGTGNSVTTVKTFDGTGRLRDSDVILQARIDSSVVPGVIQPGAPLALYYDVDPKNYFGSGDMFSRIWLPIGGMEAITGRINTEARSVNAYDIDINAYTYMIPESDAGNVSGNTIEFLFILEAPNPAATVPGQTRLLPIARHILFGDYNPANVPGELPGAIRPPFSLAPWSYKVDAPIVQRGGVSIYNNVINPNRGQKALLTYTLRKGGMVTVNVFSLDGSLVNVMHRGNQPSGTYNFYWNGKNMGGRPVARGIYFIRVVGPGIDEIRKVMVVK